MRTKRIAGIVVTATVASAQLLSPLVSSARQSPRDASSSSQVGTERTRVPRIVERYSVASNTVSDGTAAKAARDNPIPEWAATALRASLARIESEHAARALANEETNLSLYSASKDDAGRVDIRLSQQRNGVEVVSGQLIAHLTERGDVRAITGRTYDTAGAEAQPVIDEAAAVASARSAAGGDGPLASAPTARLAILPRAVAMGDARATGATLTYRVTLIKANAPGSVDVFVDARDGSIVLERDNFAAERGIAYTLYDGRVTIGTTPMTNDRYRLRDPERGNSETWDGRGLSDGSGRAFIDRTDDVWGDGTTNNRQTVGASAHNGVQCAWDFYLQRYGRLGPDGNGTAITTIAYFGASLNNAYGGDNRISIGMGDGVQFGPLASLDVVGHEFTHNVVQAAAGLSTQFEGGAVNESLADIFGDAIEASTGRAPNYLVGEDCFTPAMAGDAMRDMANPTIDHFSKLQRLAIDEQPSAANDNGYVHANSGVMSNAFYLLSEGGANAVSGMTVPAIGRAAAEDIFYVALTGYMFPGTDYIRAANATLGAATDLYGYNSPTYKAVDRAWHAVGVLVDQPVPADTLGRKLLFYSSYDKSATTDAVNPDRTLTQLNGYPAGAFGDWWWVVGDATDVFYYNGETGAAAVGNVDEAGNHTTIGSFPAGTFARGWTSIVRHKGSLFFYNQYSGVAAVGRLTGPQSFRQYNAWSTFARGWTSIVSAQGRLVFYNRDTGRLAVGDLDDVVQGAPGQFPTLVRIDYHDINASNLAAGWTHVLVTGRGIFFYNYESGAYVVGGLEANGSFTEQAPGVSPGGHQTWAYSNIGAGWNNVVRLQDTLLLYNAEDGSALTARMRGSAGVEYEIDGEPFVPCQTFTLERYFSNIVCTVDPPRPPG